LRKAYVNTSFVIALIDRGDPKHSVVLKCLHRLRALNFRVVTSDIVFEEPLRDPLSVRSALRRYEVGVIHVSVPEAYSLGWELIRGLRLSSRRLYDAMHIAVAKKAGVELFITADRKQRSLGKRLGLLVCHPIEIIEGRCP
jgi:predicted nucleic acid-binding protein